ncbi:hypothetical protein STBA_63400 [Streptomyces sp. MP131-18]|nr:hypothetical protein STBA_63400 [Streptomyces sp. MP131-18]
MFEHGRDVFGDQVEQGVVTVRGGQCGEASARRGRARLAARRGGSGVEGGADLRQSADERAGAGGGERGGEQLPAHVRDGRVAPAIGEDRFERGDRGLRVERGNAALPQPGHGVAVRHPAARPRAPGDGRGRQPAGPAAGGERVEVRVGGGVGALAAAAPHARDGGEEHEGVQRGVAEQFVEVAGARGLGRRGPGQRRGVRLRQRTARVDARRVHDGGRRVLGEQRGDGGTVRQVAGGDGDLRAQGGQFVAQFGRAGGGDAAAAGEHEVRGAVAGEAARDVRAERAGAAGDEDGTARPPGGGGAGDGGVRQAPGVQGAAARRELVLVAGVSRQTGQDRGEQRGPRPVGVVVRQVDQPAPPVGVFEADDAAEAPGHGLLRAGWRVVGPGGDGVPRHEPQRRGEVRVAQGLHGGQGVREPGGHLGPVGVRAFVEREERHNAGDGPLRGLGPQPGGQRVAGGGVVDGDGQDAGTVGGEPFQAGVGRRGVRRRGGGGQQGEPGGAGQAAGGAGGGERQPALAVAPLPPRLGARAGTGGRGGRSGPVPLALERVGGQRAEPGAGAGEQGVRVGLDAVDMEARQRGGQGPRLGPVGAEQRNGRQRGAVLRQAVGHGAGQDGVGAEFDEGGGALGVQRGDGVGEPDGGAHLPGPVGGRAGLVRRQGPPGDGGDDGDARRGVVQGLGDLPVGVEHAVQVRGVEGVGGPQPLGPAAGGVPVPRQLLDETGVPGKHRRGRPVDGGDGHAVLVSGEERRDLLGSCLDGDHRAVGALGLHQPPAGGDEGRGVGQREHPGGVGGGEFADGVAGEELRGQAPALQQPEEGHFEGEQRGLRVLGAIEQGRVGDGRAQRAVQVRGEGRAHLVERGGERRVGGGEFGAHAGPLAALSCEEERHGGIGRGRAGDDVGGGPPRGERVEAAQQVVPAARGDDGAGGQRGAGGGQRERQVGVAARLLPRAGAGARVEERVQAAGLGAQRGLVPRGQAERSGGRPGVAGRLLGGGRGRGGRRLLDDGVRVGAADAERRDAEAARPVRYGLPRHGLGQRTHGARGPVDVRARRVEVQGAWQFAVPHRLDHLDDARDARGGLGVADVGLHRAQPQRPFGVTVPAVGRQQGLRLDGVAQPGPGAVRLDGVDVGGGEARPGQGRGDAALLGRPVGRGQAVARAVLVDGGAADDGEHFVPVAPRVRKTFEQQDSGALAPAGAVGRGGERLAPAVGREAALPAELDEQVGRRHEGDRAGERQIALAAAQRLRGQVQGDQRGGAGGVDGDGRALEAERVGDAPGHDAGRGARGTVTLRDVRAVDAPALRGLGQQRRVVLPVGARVDGGTAAAERARVDARAFEQLPGEFQHQALLRVHGQRLARADAEEVGVEVGDAVEERALPHVGGAGHVRVLVEQAVEAPAAVLGERRHRVGARADQLPQLFRAVRAAGETAAHGDDDDGVLGRPRGAGRRARGGRGGAGPLGAVEEFGAEVGGERRGRGVVVDGRRGQPQAGRAVEAVAYLDAGQGVEAEVLERPPGRDGFGALVPEDGRDVAAHQVQDEPPAFVLGGLREAAGERVAARLGLLPAGVGRADGPDLGYVVQQRPGAGGGEREEEAFPVDLHDRHARVARVDGVPQRREGPLRRHAGQAVPPQQVGDVVLGGHAAVGPRAPGDGGGRQPMGVPGLGQRVEERVARGVVALAGDAEGARDGGEQHERVQRQLPGQLVQVDGGDGLREQGPFDLRRADGVDDAVVEDGRRVDHGGQRVLGGDRGDDGGQRVAVRGVAGRDRHAGAESGEFGGERVRARRLAAAAGQQQQVLGPVAGQPAGDVRAERAGAAGDERGAPRAPAAVLRHGAGGGVHEPADERADRAQRELVLGGVGGLGVGGAHSGERGGQPGTRGGIELGRQVDQAAPAVGVFQRDDAAEAPHEGLHGAAGCFAGVRGDGAAGRKPQRGRHARVAERLDEREGRGEPGGRRRVLRVRPFVEREQRQHAGGRFRGGLAQLRGQRLPPGAGRHGDEHGVRAAFRESRRRAGDVRVLGAACGRDDEPAPWQGGGAGVGERYPADAVVPGVRPGTGRGRRGRVEPVAFPLERVGRQLRAARARGGVLRGPVHGGAVHPRLGERRHEPVQAALAAPQRRQHGGPAVLGQVGGLGHADGQHRVRADLDEQRVAAVEEGGDGVAEADGAAQVAEPVVGVQLRPFDGRTGDGGVERDGGPAGPDVRERGEDVRAERLDLRRVGRVVDGDAPGAHAVRLAGGEELVQRVQFAGDDDRAGPVDRPDGEPAVPPGDQAQRPFLRDGDGHHAAEPGQGAQRLAAQRDHGGGVLEGEDARDAGRGDFALAVADDGGRLHAVGAPQRGEGHHDGEQRGLHDVDALEQGRARLGEHVGQGPVDVGGERVRARAQGVGEHR